MKKYAIALCAALPLLGACNNSATTSINNTLANLAKNDIPKACAIVDKAESYFAQIVGTPSAAIANAEAEGKAICANPPTDIASAFATLLNVWTVVQAATVAPGTKIMAPTPTPN